MSRIHKSCFALIATAVLVSCCIFAPKISFAQDSSPTEIKQNTGRKIKSSVQPEYPDLARKMHISGTVRIEATITPDGKVRATRVLGGSPVLAVEAENAVKRWRFEEAPKESVETVEIVFK